MRVNLFFCVTCILLLAACTASENSSQAVPTPTIAASASAPVATSTRISAATPSPTSSRTPFPTYTPRPSRTPKPSPTLPNGDDFACLPEEGTRVSAVVAGVTDGDTITVQIGLQNFTVRYIGIDTPETNIQPPERMAVEATTRNRELVSGKRVTLISDPEVGDTDRYGRLLRFIVFEDAFVNAVLIREGFARYYASPNACGSLFFSAETEARAARVGLWLP